MKRLFYIFLVSMFVWAFAGCAGSADNNKGASKASVGESAGSLSPIVAATPKVALSKKAVVQFSGKGFKAGQEVTILFKGDDGVMSDIGYALKPKPVADEKGNWKTTWKCGRFVKKKLIKEGTYSFEITDKEYEALAKTKVKFVKKSVPTAFVTPPEVKLSKKAVVEFNGKGFKAGQEVSILFIGDDGVRSDIGYALKAKPVADAKGNWKTTWKCGRFVKKKLIKEGTYSFEITDKEYKALAKTKVNFVKK